MKHNKVVAFKNLPSRMPLWPTAVTWLVMDRIHAPGWAWGVAATVMVSAWISSLYGMATQKLTEISCEAWKQEKPNVKRTGSTE